MPARLEDGLLRIATSSSPNRGGGTSRRRSAARGSKRRDFTVKAAHPEIEDGRLQVERGPGANRGRGPRICRGHPPNRGRLASNLDMGLIEPLTAPSRLEVSRPRFVAALRHGRSLGTSNRRRGCGRSEPGAAGRLVGPDPKPRGDRRYRERPDDLDRPPGHDRPARLAGNRIQGREGRRQPDDRERAEGCPKACCGAVRRGSSPSRSTITGPSRAGAFGR